MTDAAFRRTILAAYGGAVMVLLLAPIRAPRVAARVPEADKIVHAALFGLMAYLIWWNLTARRWTRALWAVALSGLLASAVEVLQSIIPYRSADPVDAAAGLAGAVLCAALLLRTPPSG